MSQSKTRPLNPLLASLDAVDWQAITHGWKKHNKRRLTLIDMESSAGIGTEELVELEELQRLAPLRWELINPLPWHLLEALEYLLVSVSGRGEGETGAFVRLFVFLCMDGSIGGREIGVYVPYKPIFART